MAAFVIGFLAEKINPKSFQTNPKNTLKLPLLFLIGHVIIISLGFLHLYRIPDYTLEVIEELKNLIPSFLVKMGIFTVLLSMVGRKFRV